MGDITSILRSRVIARTLIAGAGESWRTQLRDRRGRWIEMGRDVEWLSQGRRMAGRISGVVDGLVEVEEHKTGQKYKIPSTRLTQIEEPGKQGGKGTLPSSPGQPPKAEMPEQPVMSRYLGYPREVRDSAQRMVQEVAGAVKDHRNAKTAIALGTASAVTEHLGQYPELSDTLNTVGSAVAAHMPESVAVHGAVMRWLDEVFGSQPGTGYIAEVLGLANPFSDPVGFVQGMIEAITNLIQMLMPLVTSAAPDHALLAGGGESWRWQLRDRRGRWIEMGAKVSWLAKGMTRTGVVTGSPSPGTAEVEESSTKRRLRIATNRLMVMVNAIETKRAEARAKKATAPGTQRTTTVTAYPNARRTPDGRVILTPKQLKKMDPHDPHDASYKAHIEKVTVDGAEVWALSREREKWHDKVVNQALAGIVPHPSGKKTATWIGGGPGAGKSTATKATPGYPKTRDFDKVNDPPGEAVLVDGDAIKLDMPEWKAKNAESRETAAGWAHEESSVLADVIRDAAVERGLDFVVDGTGDKGVESMRAKIDGAKSNGYEVRGVYVTVPASESLVRSLERSREKGRYMPIQPLLDIHRDVVPIVAELPAEFDAGFNLYDTDVVFGDPPIPIVVEGKIVDQARFDAHQAKRNVTDVQALEEALQRAQNKEYRKIKDPDNPGKSWTPEEMKTFTIEKIQELLDDARAGRELQ